MIGTSIMKDLKNEITLINDLTPVLSFSDLLKSRCKKWEKFLGKFMSEN